MNIIEKYLDKYDQMIIMLIGMPTSNKSDIAKELHEDIIPKFTLININDYIQQKIINIEIKNIKFKLYDHPNNINYEKLINDVNDKKSTGIIIYGNYIDYDKIKDKIIIDFSYFFDIKPLLLKKNLIEKKILPYIDEINNVSNIKNNQTITNINIISKNNSVTDQSFIEQGLDNISPDNSSDNSSEKSSISSISSNDDKINLKLEIYIKDILLPIYENIKKTIKFIKFYNVKEDTKFMDIYDNLFENLMDLIKKNIYK